MITPPDALDQLVRGYLHAVEQASAGLPQDRREELLSDLRDHIAAERAALSQPTEAAVRAILDRLGEPATLAAEARLLADDAPPAWNAAPIQPARKRRLGPLGWTLVAVGLTMLTCLALILVGLINFSAGRATGELIPTSSVPSQEPTHR